MVGPGIDEERRGRCDQGPRGGQRRGTSLAHGSWLYVRVGDLQPRQSATGLPQRLAVRWFRRPAQALGPRRGEGPADLLDEDHRATPSEVGDVFSDKEPLV